jgi:hypothetical protein
MLVKMSLFESKNTKIKCGQDVVTLLFYYMTLNESDKRAEIK